MIETIDRVLGRLVALYHAVSKALLAGLVLLVGTQVVLRYLTDHSILWAGEVAIMMFTWMVFLAAVVLHRKARHITVTVAVDRFPAAARRAAGLIVSVGVIVFGVVVLTQVRAIWALIAQTATPVLDVPDTAFATALAVGMATIVAQEAVNLVRMVLGRR